MQLTLPNLPEKIKETLLNEASQHALSDNLSGSGPQDLLESRALTLPIFVLLAVTPNPSKEQILFVHNFSVAMFSMWHSYTLLDGFLDGDFGAYEIIAMQGWTRIGDQYLERMYREYPLMRKPMQKAFIKTEEYYRWEISDARLDKKTITAELNSKTSEKGGTPVICEHESQEKSLSVEDYNYIAVRMSAYLESLKQLVLYLGLDARIASQIYKYFKNIIIADQLKDDLIDWEDDLKRGILTYVTGQIAEAGIRRSKQRNYFSTQVEPKVKKEIEQLLQKAAKVMSSIPDNSLNKELLLRPLNLGKSGE